MPPQLSVPARPEPTSPPCSPAAVREVEMPEATRELSTLARVDYTDCVVLDSDLAARRSGEEWARAILEGAPPATRAALRRGWSLLRLRLGSTSDEERILGWELRRRAPDYALLATSTPIGAEAEVLCKRERETLLVGTFMQLNNPVGRLVWGLVAPRHRRVVRHLLMQAGRRVAEELA